MVRHRRGLVLRRTDAQLEGTSETNKICPRKNDEDEQLLVQFEEHGVGQTTETENRHVIMHLLATPAVTTPQRRLVKSMRTSTIEFEQLALTSIRTSPRICLRHAYIWSSGRVAMNSCQFIVEANASSSSSQFTENECSLVNETWLETWAVLGLDSYIPARR